MTVAAGPGGTLLTADTRTVALWDVPPAAELPEDAISSNLRVCRDTLEVVPVSPALVDASPWAPRAACAPSD